MVETFCINADSIYKITYRPNKPKSSRIRAVFLMFSVTSQQRSPTFLTHEIITNIKPQSWVQKRVPASLCCYEDSWILSSNRTEQSFKLFLLVEIKIFPFSAIKSFPFSAIKIKRERGK